MVGTLRSLTLAFAVAVAAVAGGPMTAANAVNAHDFRFTAIEGGALPMAIFKGKAVLGGQHRVAVRLHASI